MIGLIVKVRLAAVVRQVAVVVPSVRLTIDSCQAVRRVVDVICDECAGDGLRGSSAVADGVVGVGKGVSVRAGIGRAGQAIEWIVGVTNRCGAGQRLCRGEAATGERRNAPPIEAPAGIVSADERSHTAPAAVGRHGAAGNRVVTGDAIVEPGDSARDRRLVAGGIFGNESQGVVAPGQSADGLAECPIRLNRQWHSQHAYRLYQRGPLNLSGAARYANVGVERMMRELTRRGVEHGPSVEPFADGLETLADLFGKDELRAAAAEAHKQAGSEFV